MEEGLVHLERIAQMKEPQDSKSKAHYYDGLIILSRYEPSSKLTLLLFIVLLPYKASTSFLKFHVSLNTQYVLIYTFLDGILVL